MPTLPAPRSVLNALLDRIATIPLPDPNPAAPNPLALIPPSHRHLIITLHVLFPALLLPALDLLDRGLVVRVVLDTSLSYYPPPPPPPPPRNTPGQGVNQEKGKQEQPSFYLVSSSQTPPPPRKRQQQSDGAGGQGKAYIARLKTWHCTCDGFAFAVGLRRGSATTDKGTEEETEGRQLGFGGRSVDGPDEGTPVCRHLLACLLAERWEGIGGYVRERRVGREEMAGLVADV